MMLDRSNCLLLDLWIKVTQFLMDYPATGDEHLIAVYF